VSRRRYSMLPGYDHLCNVASTAGNVCHIRCQAEGFVYFAAYVLLLSHKNSFDLDRYEITGTQKAESEMFVSSDLRIAVKNTIG
jgi:hypothetical protein